jgi:hypothetical protein
VDEQPLAGGNFSAVVRVGDTVRRETGPWTPAVHALLRHLEAVGFEGAPRVLGSDEQEREILTFVEGDVPHEWPMPAYVWTDETAFAVGTMTRRYHDACAGFLPPPDAHWRKGVDGPGVADIVCHHDIAPWNMVFRDGRPHALIDWDFAGPGTRLWDLAYAAWRFAPLYAPWRTQEVGSTPGDEGRRIRLLCDGYGLADRSSLLDTIVARMHRMHDALVESPNPNSIRLVAEGHHLNALEDARWVESQRERLEAEL